MGFSISASAGPLAFSGIPCRVNQLFTDLMNNWKSSYWSFNDQSKLGGTRVVGACGDSFFSTSMRALIDSSPMARGQWKLGHWGWDISKEAAMVLQLGAQGRWVIGPR